MALCSQGDIEFAFYPEVAPVTTMHIFKLVQLGVPKHRHNMHIHTMTESHVKG